MAPDDRIKDVKETEDGSRWLTILDSWLPTDNGTDVDALLDELSLDCEGDNQRRRHGLISSYHKRLSPIRVHRCSLGRCLHFIWEYMRQLEPSDVQEPADLPRVSACYPRVCLRSRLKPNSEFGKPPMYRQHEEMNVRCPIQDMSAMWPDFLKLFTRHLGYVSNILRTRRNRSRRFGYF
jgi:hypothetical protein